MFVRTRLNELVPPLLPFYRRTRQRTLYLKLISISCPNQFVARSRIRQVWFLWSFTNGQFVPISGMGSWDVKQGTYPGQIARRDAVPRRHFDHRLGPDEFVKRLARHGRGRLGFHEIRNPRATGKKSERESAKMALRNYTIILGKMARPRGFEPLAT